MFCCIFFPSSRCFAAIPESHKLLAYLQLLSWIYTTRRTSLAITISGKVHCLLTGGSLQYQNHSSWASFANCCDLESRVHLYLHDSNNPVLAPHLLCYSHDLTSQQASSGRDFFCYSSCENLAILYCPISLITLYLKHFRKHYKPLLLIATTSNTVADAQNPPISQDCCCCSYPTWTVKQQMLG